MAGVTVVCDLSKASLANLRYPDILQRCIQNVLEWSIRSCPEHANGKVLVSVQHGIAPESLKIEIVDNGCELAADELRLLEDPMAEVEQWDRFLISLAVSRKIAKGLGGELSAENRKGSGNSFIVTLNTAGGPD